MTRARGASRGQFVSPSRVKGVVHFLEHPLAGCRDTTVRYTAGALADPTDGGYEGTTAQDLPVFFGVRGRTVTNVKFSVVVGSCGKMTIRWPGAKAEVDESGSFSYDGGQGTFRGQFVTPSRATGTIWLLPHPLAGCPGQTVRYTAHHR